MYARISRDPDKQAIYIIRNRRTLHEDAPIFYGLYVKLTVYLNTYCLEIDWLLWTRRMVSAIR